MNEEITFPYLQAVLIDYIEELWKGYRKNLKKNDHIASMNLIDTIEIVTDFDGDEYWVGFNLQDYWKYVEYDTKPHFPPVDALLKWVKIKPVLPRPDKRGKLPTQQQLAFLIGRKISEEGTTGTHDLEMAKQSIEKKYEDLIAEALAKDVENHINWLLKLYVK